MKDDVQLYFGVNCDALICEYPFFRDGMWLSEFQSEQQKYFDYIEKGGDPKKYISTLK